jgi:hypothetical protein
MAKYEMQEIAEKMLNDQTANEGGIGIGTTRSSGPSITSCHPDEGVAKFLQNVGSYKSHKA